MTKRSRTHAPCGGRIRPDGGWAGYLQAVREAAVAAKRRERPKHEITKSQLDALRPGRIRLVDKAPRCAAIAVKTGNRCRCAAVRGSTLCHNHGGLMEVPQHPATIRIWGGEAGERMQAAIDARIAFAAFPKAIKDAVGSAFRATVDAKRRRRGKWPTLLAGAQALDNDPSGKSFRRWLADLNNPVSDR